jgi:hypothetical protein
VLQKGKHILPNTQKPSAEGNFCDKYKRGAHKPAVVENYNWLMGYLDKGDKMANCYSISQRT